MSKLFAAGKFFTCSQQSNNLHTQGSTLFFRRANTRVGICRSAPRDLEITSNFLRRWTSATRVSLESLLFRHLLHGTLKITAVDRRFVKNITWNLRQTSGFCTLQHGFLGALETRHCFGLSHFLELKRRAANRLPYAFKPWCAVQL